MTENYVNYRLSTYDIKNNTFFQRCLKEVHIMVLELLSKKGDTLRRRVKSIKQYLSQLPSDLKKSLCSDIFPTCEFCQELLETVQIKYCINPRDDFDQYIFILKSDLSLSGQCRLRIKEHFEFIVFD